MLLSAVAPVAASNDIRIIVDGIVVNFDVQPQIIDGRTMVPLRAIFEALGATVDWNESTKTITANKGDLFVKCAIGSYSMDTSSGSKTIDVPPTIINSRTLVPARFIAEGFNCDVQWDAANRRVTITSAPVEYVIVEHGDKKDEQKDNTVKQDNNNSEENEDTDKNDNKVKDTDDEQKNSTVKQDNNNLAKNDSEVEYYEGSTLPLYPSIAGAWNMFTEFKRYYEYIHYTPSIDVYYAYTSALVDKYGWTTHGEILKKNISSSFIFHKQKNEENKKYENVEVKYDFAGSMVIITIFK